MSHQVQKTITWLLRHGASQENVPIDEDGFITINNLINWLKKKNIHLNKQDINNIVAADKKTRYLLKDDMIRANQGHSIKLQIQMDSFKQNNSQLVHATYYDNMESIQKSGLKSPTSVGKDPTVRRRRSKPLIPLTLVGGGSV